MGVATAGRSGNSCDTTSFSFSLLTIPSSYSFVSSDRDGPVVVGVDATLSFV